jgi:hypothetical protein
MKSTIKLTPTSQFMNQLSLKCLRSWLDGISALSNSTYSRNCHWSLVTERAWRYYLRSTVVVIYSRLGSRFYSLPRVKSLQIQLWLGIFSSFYSDGPAFRSVPFTRGYFCFFYTSLPCYTLYQYASFQKVRRDTAETMGSLGSWCWEAICWIFIWTFLEHISVWNNCHETDRRRRVPVVLPFFPTRFNFRNFRQFELTALRWELYSKQIITSLLTIWWLWRSSISSKMDSSTRYMADTRHYWQNRLRVDTR